MTMVNPVPPKYVQASAIASLSGLANGLDTGCIGGIIHMPQFTATVGELSATMLGFTVSLIMLAGVLPSIFAGHVADRFGRVKTVMFGSGVYTIGMILEGTATGLPQFLVGRVLAGMAQAFSLGNASVYICEIAPARSRGMLSSMPQLMACAGVCWGYFLCYTSISLEGSMAWRLGFIAQTLNSASLFFLCFMLPESPRWLLVSDRRADAIRSLERLQFSMAEAERDFLSATDSRPTLSLWQSYVLIFRRNYRARTILGLFVLGMVQLSGIDGVIYYAPILFGQAGLDSNTAGFLASGISSILILVVTVPGLLMADKWGRRTSAISGGVGLAGCMLLIGSLYAANAVQPTGAARWVVIVSVFAFGIIFCATWGIVGKIYASEIQPSHTRGAANCLAMGLSYFANWLVAMLTPILLESSAHAAYFLFGGMALGNRLILAAYMPETRGRSLENIQEAFQRPSFGAWLSSLRGITSTASAANYATSYLASACLATRTQLRPPIDLGVDR
ncbi:general substrate transporter [Plectosphaerella plurivora]|uniref:General substrate transporter n=1 Tax=Plectosphaerella plurivora TaxID=936078 RepID=A0A9P8VDD5_9PEZI|nr:general substrate transporter [Plectosphaerella plurivora]